TPYIEATYPVDKPKSDCRTISIFSDIFIPREAKSANAVLPNAASGAYAMRLLTRASLLLFNAYR
ncbi:MAG: hypothetical protein SPL54_10285, partial [Lachnospiraceae bacterium]|nr:hypothetical protein [Lachnospiraceae bacterium]